MAGRGAGGAPLIWNASATKPCKAAMVEAEPIMPMPHGVHGRGWQADGIAAGAHKRASDDAEERRIAVPSSPPHVSPAMECAFSH